MLTCSVHPLPYRANPADYFAAIRNAPGAVLLDSGRPSAERGRYDLLSAWPLEQLAVLPDENGAHFVQRLRDNLSRLGEAQLPAGYELPFAGGLIGYLSYDFGRHLENLPSQALDDLQLPDARFWPVRLGADQRSPRANQPIGLSSSLVDSERQRLVALFTQPQVDALAPFKLNAPMAADLSADDYRQAFERIQDYIQAGDCYQVNFAQRFRAECQGDPWLAYCALRQACPTPFSGFQSLPDGGAVLSLSPERFVRVSQRQVEPVRSRAPAPVASPQPKTPPMPPNCWPAPRIVRKT